MRKIANALCTSFIAIIAHCVLAPSACAQGQVAMTSLDSDIVSKGIDVTFDVKRLTNINVMSLREASGLAVSQIDARVMWSHNDSGRGPLLFAFDMDGVHRGTYILQGIRAHDWEDMASFMWQGTSWIAIADTGDNAAKRSTMQVHLVHEPLLPAKKKMRTQPLQPNNSIEFVFPHGAADCEAIAVDSREEKIYLLTKRQKPPRLYSIPLTNRDTTGDSLVAKFEGEIRALPLPQLQELIDFPSNGIYRSQPTAMDFSPQGHFVVIATYGNSYLYERKSDQNWIDILREPGMKIRVPFMKQNEAVAVSVDGQTIFYTSEGTNPPLYQVRFPVK